MRLRLLGTVAVAVSMLAAGCSDEPGAAEPPVNDPTANVPVEPTAEIPGTSETGGAPANAPKVSNPVQALDKFVKAPCDMLPKSEAAKLGYDADIAVPTDATSGPECKWRAASGDNFSILITQDQPLGIGGIYRNHEQRPYAYFEPVDIAGFPGVFNDTLDERANGFCGLDVGVTDQQIITLTATTTQGRQDDPCELLQKAARAAVTTMSKA